MRTRIPKAMRTMGFKDQVASDLNTVLNLDEFAEIHDIDGEPVKIVLDSDLIHSRPHLYRSQDNAEGTYQNRVVFFVRAADLGYRPVEGQVLSLDSQPYLVVQVGEDMGLLTVTLEGNQI